LAAQVTGSGLSSPILVLIFAAYSIYAIAVLFWRNLDETGHPGASLAIDAVVLFVALTASNPRFALLGVVLYAFVLSVAIILYDWWRPIVIATLCIVVVNFGQPSHYAVIFPCLIGAGIIVSIVSLERHFLKERLSNASRQGVLYRYDAEKAREAERQRIAADFHDGPLQSFHSFQIRLEVIRKLLQRDKASAEDELHLLQKLCKDQVLELRAFVASMRPVEMEGSSLNASLRRVVDQFSKDSGIPASFISTEFVDPEEPEVSLEVLQIVREALYNVQRHSGASRVAVGITPTEHTLEISIEDNGSGFSFSGSYNLEELELLRLGPKSIKRRVRSLGGELLIDSRPGHGAGLRIRLVS
jgi:signal transduction histidine kinase